MKEISYIVVGVTFEGRQELLSNFYKNYRHGGIYNVKLMPEPWNEYDKNAIAVMLEIDGGLKKIGYIPKTENEDLHRHMPDVTSVCISSMGPNYKGILGLNIKVSFQKTN